MEKNKNFDRLNPLEKIVRAGLCVGCGFCFQSLKAKAFGNNIEAEMVYDSRMDYFIPKVKKWESEERFIDFVCPGVKIDMVGLSRQIYGKLPEDSLLGIYKSLRICYSTEPLIRQKAASGGVIPVVLNHLFSSGEIDFAYCVKTVNGPYSNKGQIIYKPEELKNIHGSVYHPVNFGAELNILVDDSGRFAFVGLPCQVAALEMLKVQMPTLAKRHILSIGLFCGGVNTFKGVAYYLKGFGISWEDVEKISYREGAWPGKIKVILKSGKELLIPRIQENTRWKILRYVIAFQGYWMLRRCRLCPDPINDFADISVGDPHLPKYKSSKEDGFSIVITRTDKGEQIIKKILADEKLASESISSEEVVESQGYTIDNRRHVKAYIKVSELFGFQVPEVRVYPGLEKLSFRHYVYAAVDLMKIVLPKWKIMELLYIPWQIFEYLFITFAPMMTLKRLIKLVRNR